MKSPKLLQPPPLVRRADPLVSVNLFVGAALCGCLLVAAVLAVYTWTTPAVEVPLALAIAVVFLATVVFDVLVLSVRHRSRGQGHG